VDIGSCTNIFLQCLEADYPIFTGHHESPIVWIMLEGFGAREDSMAVCG